MIFKNALAFLLSALFIVTNGISNAQSLKPSSLKEGDKVQVFDDPGFPGYRVQDGKRALQTYPIGNPESSALVIRDGVVLGFLTPESVLDWYRIKNNVTFDEVLSEVRGEIEHAKNSKKYTLNQTDPITLPFPDIQARLQKDTNGNCNLSLAVRFLEVESPRTFYRIGFIVHSLIGCKQVLVDMTNSGGALTAGVFIGTYIRESGWQTTYGGFPLKNEDYNETCRSTCTNIVYGGVRRYSNRNQFLVHQPSTGKGVDQICASSSAPEIEMYRRYLDYVSKDFGIELFEYIFSVPCSTLAPLPQRLVQKIFVASQ